MRSFQAVILSLAFLIGCQRADPLERPVAAASPLAYRMWQTRFTRDSKLEERQRFEEALQDIRLKIMSDREAKGSEAIDEALRRKIDGRPVREVMQLGIEARIERLSTEAQALDLVIKQNSMLQTRPGDKASESYLVSVYQKQAARLDKLQSDILDAERELAPLMKISGRLLLTPSEPSPTKETSPAKVDPAFYKT